MKPIICSSRMITIPEKEMKVTIAPTVVSPCVNNQAPSATIHKILKVVDERVKTLTSAHHDSTGICAPKTR